MLMTMQLGIQKHSSPNKVLLLNLSALCMLLLATTPAAAQSPVPGFVPPVQQTMAPDYADDTRGIFVPHHKQLRMKSHNELNQDHRQRQLAQASGGHVDDFEAEMNRLAGQEPNQFETEMDRIAGQQGRRQVPQGRQTQNPSSVRGFQANQPPHQQRAPSNNTFSQHAPNFTPDGGVEMMQTTPSMGTRVDMNNALVRVREERITVRRIVQRMMDQIGASDWTIVWDLSHQNSPLAEMEISIDAHEPFSNVLNALLARLQTRSGDPLRVIRYDNTRRLVITDRTSGHRLAGNTVSPFGVQTDGDVMVTEQMLKEAMISLHYDEIPLVDALESIVNQAGKGQWRLRVYAGLDQVLKPAHIEEPFSTAVERLLRLFNLKYEIFPGGKLVVITKSTRFGFSADQ